MKLDIPSIIALSIIWWIVIIGCLEAVGIIDTIDP
jgi:hypothetical protein